MGPEMYTELSENEAVRREFSVVAYIRMLMAQSEFDGRPRGEVQLPFLKSDCGG